MGRSIIQVRVEDELKEDVMEVLDKIGMDMPNAIRMYLKRIVLEQGIPFDTKLPLENDLYQDKNVNDTRIEVIPAAKFKYVSSDEFYEVLSMVPAGKITRYEDIIEYLKRRHKVSRVEINYTINLLTPIDRGVPLWRLVSTRGFVQGDHFYMGREKCAEKLEEEGFNVIPGGIRGESLKVENYREYLFDFNKETYAD